MARTSGIPVPEIAEHQPPAHERGSSKLCQRGTCAVVAPARYVLLCLAEQLTGYTVKAMERKIERGDWVEGKLWIRGPDGRILIDMVGYHRWVERAQ